jgi:hypothetical protein
MAGSPARGLCALGCRPAGAGREGTAEVSRERDSGSLPVGTPTRTVRALGTPPEGRQHQRPAHRGHLATCAGCEKMRWVRIEDVGDTEFLIGAQTDTFRFTALRDTVENERVIQAGGRPATAQPMLLGITKALLAPQRAHAARWGPRAGRPTRSSRRRRLPRGPQRADYARWGGGNDACPDGGVDLREDRAGHRFVRKAT